ncbi:tumor necrosis factor ligand superfamily member 6-like [Heptranchias perlo]|uniref:tumor necrosis factor ligand superfamily member 6-like n=1 Tax=Heptranchias perlo TaxID=212740 RepID=UPI00355A7378
MEVTGPLNEEEVPLRARGKCPRVLFYWSLVIMLTSGQVLAASCLTFYFLNKQLQNVTERLVIVQPSVEKCITHWTGSTKSHQGPGEEEKTLAWETVSGQVFTGDCTEYKENATSLEIKRAGNYFVYVQVMFKGHSNNVKFIMDFDGIPKIQNSRNSTGQDSKTVYFGSTYKLRPGTKIFVRSNPKYVQFGESKTFFGLFEL